jgi:outer membrane protein OmpA-like peptidoglycan-associated protein
MGIERSMRSVPPKDAGVAIPSRRAAHPLLAASLILTLAACSPERAPTARKADPAVGGPALDGTLRDEREEAHDLHEERNALGRIVTVPGDLLFAGGSATLTPEAGESLLTVANMIRAAGPGAVQVVGHGDTTADEGANQRLTAQRAQAVADWLGRQVGLERRRFVVLGRGAADPVAEDTRLNGLDDAEGRARNRRIEIAIPE